MTNEFKGTKGELILHGEAYDNSNGFIVQAVSSEFDNNMLFCNTYGHTKEEAIANAKLIACAPLMLKLLIKITPHLPYLGLMQKEAGILIQKATEL